MSRNCKINTKPIHIGVIGTPPLVRACQRALKLFPSFVPLIDHIDADLTLEEIIAKRLPDVEVLLFTEYRTYAKGTAHKTYPIPLHYVPFRGGGLYKALFHVYTTGKPAALSIDSLTDASVQDVYGELQQSLPDVHVYQGDSTAPVNDIIQFHHTCQKTTVTLSP
ncbi:hypothetical protein G4V62_18000 [Bacillaceae bacterium SIJ1]|uniref:hypothetical protein n=1 Tax=Litoribacterium kuwaitense TaxID=1398745 RepID=UPI0013EB9059|nr:hypothetical protein [Litoribacterium kuwaitense]NGP46744.1 hypothetical protein [Litoribacterium kuwaitense]